MVNLGRAWMALQRGFQAGFLTAVNTYNASDHVAEIEFDFTEYDTRIARYWHNRRYADNTIYHSVNSYADTYKFKESLYKHIRGLRNPIGRLIHIESAKILGGAIDYESFDTGAIVIDGADDTLLDALRQIMRWSNMDTLKNLYVREGATMGDIALKVVDDVDRERVRLEVLDPRKVYDVQFDEVGNVKAIDIRYDCFDRTINKWYQYRETIDKERFATYRDGELYAYTTDGNGNNVAEWDNVYGFVPVEWTQHISTVHGFGVTSFHHARHKIDNLNDLATLIHDNVRKAVNAKFFITGTRPDLNNSGSPATITVSDDNRDKSPLIYGGTDSDIKPIVSPIDIEGALQAALDQQREIESDLPQLALQRMREQNTDLSGVAIENMYSDAIDIIGELQGNYSASLKSALQMATSIGAFRRYEDFRAYNLDSYHNGLLDFDIKPRVLFRDALSTKERLELTQVALESKAPELMLRELDYSEKDIFSAKRESMRNQAITIRRAPPTQDNQQVNPNTDEIPSDVVDTATQESVA